MERRLKGACGIQFSGDVIFKTGIFETHKQVAGSHVQNWTSTDNHDQKLRLTTSKLV